MRLVAIVFMACMLATPLGAQWLHYPASGIPRTADGKPDLGAITPRAADGKPDLSGRWRKRALSTALTADDRLPWAKALYEERFDNFGKDSPAVACLPWGPATITGEDTFKIVQTPMLIVMLWEDLTYRQIFTDGRDLPRDPNPSWMGYSIGRWDGDTLVVQSIGFTDRSWLSASGDPHSEDLRLTERYRRIDFGHMELEVTVDDPKTYRKPWSKTFVLELDPDTEFLEYICNENEKSRTRMVGRRSESADGEVHLDAISAARFVGTYDVRVPNGKLNRVDITHDGPTLFFQREGQTKIQLIPTSPTKFRGPAGEYEFFFDANGEVTHFTTQAVGGTVMGVRRR